MQDHTTSASTAENTLGPRSQPAQFFVLALVLGGMIWISTSNYAIFHSMVELFCLVIAASVQVVVFHTRRLLENHYLLLVGIGFVSFIALGIPHVLAYKGVALFPGFDNDLPTQAFMAQRLVLAATFLLAPTFVHRRLNFKAWALVYAVLTSVLLMSLLVWQNFPSMFVEGVGLTPLKKSAEYVLSAMFIAAGARLLVHRHAFEPRVLRLTVLALASFAASEIAFTLYATPFGLSNLGGHVFQLAAFWFVYMAVVVTALVNPFALLFRELAESESSLSEANLELRALSAISDAAISSLDTKPLVRTLLERLVEVMGADAAVLMLASEGTLSTVATVGMEESGFAVPVGEGFSGGIAQRQEPDFVLDASIDERIVDTSLREQGVVSMLGVPLLLNGELIGVLHVDWHRKHERDEGELHLLQVVAERFSVALSNARRFEGERHVAHVLQESLMAAPAPIPGVRFASAYRSALLTARVGGDFYDVFELGKDHVGILIGDVSGKGLDAAVLTSVIRNTIRAHASSGEVSPSQVVSDASMVVERTTDASVFATLIFAVLDCRTGELAYCNAGHTTAAIIQKNGELVLLSPNSPLIGAFPESVFAEDTSRLNDSDTLVLYTDGVIEARGEGKMYGEDRLLSLLATLSGAEPDALVDAVMADVATFSGDALGDDVAILALCRESTS